MKNKTIKFKLDTKKGQKVYRIELNIRSKHEDCLCSMYKDGLFVETLKIVHQTKHKIALSDDFLTVLDRQKIDQRKESYNHFLEYPSVSIKTQENYFPNGIFCQCYTVENPEKSINKMKQIIINKINKEYGFLRTLNIEEIISEMEIINL